MRTLLWFIVGLGVFALAYVFIVRPWACVQSPVFERFCARADQFYARLFLKSRTLVVARLTWLAGYLVSFYDLILPALSVISESGLDWQGFFNPQVAKFIGPGLIIIGHIFAKLRTVTTEALKA